jgi:hypothetical protein
MGAAVNVLHTKQRRRAARRTAEFEWRGHAARLLLGPDQTVPGDLSPGYRMLKAPDGEGGEGRSKSCR